MSLLSSFRHAYPHVRMQTDVQGRRWLNANDVCEMLGIVNPRMALHQHVYDEDVQKLIEPTAGGPQLANHISETGLFAIIMGSTTAAAVPLKRIALAQVRQAFEHLPERAAVSSPAPLPMPPRPTPPLPVAINASMLERVEAVLSVSSLLHMLPGMSPAAVVAATLVEVKNNTGLCVDSLLAALPAYECQL